MVVLGLCRPPPRSDRFATDVDSTFVPDGGTGREGIDQRPAVVPSVCINVGQNR